MIIGVQLHRFSTPFVVKESQLLRTWDAAALVSWWSPSALYSDRLASLASPLMFAVSCPGGHSPLQHCAEPAAGACERSCKQGRKRAVHAKQLNRSL